MALNYVNYVNYHIYSGDVRDGTPSANTEKIIMRDIIRNTKCIHMYVTNKM